MAPRALGNASHNDGSKERMSSPRLAHSKAAVQRVLEQNGDLGCLRLDLEDRIAVSADGDQDFTIRELLNELLAAHDVDAVWKNLAISKASRRRLWQVLTTVSRLQTMADLINAPLVTPRQPTTPQPAV